MLRYIYLLCFIYFELVFCYNSIHVKEHRRLRRRQGDVGHKSHRTTPGDAFENLDLINFMQKPDSEAFDSYTYEKPQRSSLDDQSVEVPSPRLRRSRHEPYEQNAQHPRMRSRHLSHPKRKCALAMFPFFSHKSKNKTKIAPPVPKHDKRKSHSFRFSKTKERGYNPPMVPDKREEKLKQDHVTESKIEVTTMKDLNSNCKLKNSAKIVHNSRLYFANPYRISNEDASNGN